MRKPALVMFVVVLLPLACSLSILVGGSNLAQTGSGEASRSGPAASETFINPPEIVSSGGVLSATLTAKKARVRIGNKDVMARGYNGLYIPPTLRARPGDKIKLKLVNTLDAPTNLHYHGLEVSPLGRSDNVFIHLGTSEAFDYEIAIPRDQGPGLYWYHPHAHGLAESQVAGGMSGGLIIEGILDPFPELKGISERIMLLKDSEIDGDQIGQKADPAKSTRTLNGLVNPTVKIHPGETQFWRIGNIGANAYYRLQLEGHKFYQIAQDGNRLNQIVELKEVLLPPGSRVEVLVRGGAPGTYKFRSLAFKTGPQGDQNPEVTLATLISEGPAQPPVPLPSKLPPVADLRKQPVAHRREVVFTEGPGKFFINGKQFDMDRVDTTVNLGDVEEWTIRNEADELHTFHIHQVDFQVVEVNGQKTPFMGVQDNVNVPVRGVVKILVPFTDPLIVGKFVYHCHILSHEDKGMMAVIEVKPR
ncbi:MAG TPA: multicopper oxidase family protein [Bradyrhizobium sp.]|nr:multicopper oxidase family protein [Bradyrhizobium sp.]